MSKRPELPPALLRGPFTVDDAMRAGLTRRQVLGASWVRLAPAIYCWRGWKQEPLPILRLMASRLPNLAFFSGRTAAWLHRVDLDPFRPVEITTDRPYESPSRGWLSIRRRQLGPGDVCIVRGLAATSPLRTVVDLARYLEATEAVVAVDMALHGRLVTLDDLGLYLAKHPRCHRARRLRRVIGLADPAAESPQETRLRLALNVPGLPKPESQGIVRDGRGNIIARVDLLYRRQRPAVEYDGPTHRDSIVADARRTNALPALGIRLLKVTSSDLAAGRETVVGLVRTALAA